MIDYKYEPIPAFLRPIPDAQVEKMVRDTEERLIPKVTKRKKAA